MGVVVADPPVAVGSYVRCLSGLSGRPGEEAPEVLDRRGDGGPLLTLLVGVVDYSLLDESSPLIIGAQTVGTVGTVASVSAVLTLEELEEVHDRRGALVPWDGAVGYADLPHLICGETISSARSLRHRDVHLHTRGDSHHEC